MLGVNYAFQQLKKGLELKNTRYPGDSKAGYVAMDAGASYPFRPVENFLRSKENFGLESSTAENGYRFPEWSACFFDGKDVLNLGAFFSEKKPEEWKRIRSLSKSVENAVEKIVGSHKTIAVEQAVHFYQTKGKKEKIYNDMEKLKKSATDLLKPVIETAETVNSILNQYVSVGKDARVKISSQLEGLDVYGEPRDKEFYFGVHPARWNVNMKLSADVPGKIDMDHPLVSGISKNSDYIKLFLPKTSDPEIVINISKTGAEPNYRFNLKDSGVSENALKEAVDLLML
jgi:hypothetical protein